MSSMRCSWLCGISRSFLLLSPAQGQVTYVLLTRSPLISKRDSFDLHVLGTPPAFILSQDQTLHEICEELMFSSSIKCFQINLTCICSVFNVLSALLTGVLTYITTIHFACKACFAILFIFCFC